MGWQAELPQPQPQENAFTPSSALTGIIRKCNTDREETRSPLILTLFILWDQYSALLTETLGRFTSPRLEGTATIRPWDWVQRAARLPSSSLPPLLLFPLSPIVCVYVVPPPLYECVCILMHMFSFGAFFLIDTMNSTNTIV